MLFRYIFNIREYLIKFTSFNIIAIKYNNKIYKNLLIKYLSPIYYFGFNYIFNYFKIEYLYKLDNIYFYQDYNNSKKITNIILKVKLIYNDNNNKEILDITNSFKEYYSNVPFYLYLMNENIYNIIKKNIKENIIYNKYKYDNIYDYLILSVNTLKNGKIITNDYKLNEIIKLKIYEII